MLSERHQADSHDSMQCYECASFRQYAEQHTGEIYSFIKLAKDIFAESALIR